MQDFPEVSWMERYRERVNADPEMQVIGGWMTDINPAPRIDSRASFGFRAPMDVWRKFVSPQPPALYHDFFAMLMRVPEFVLEGDGLVAMQNARALQRMMNLMRG
jgi:hypothetical protein